MLELARGTVATVGDGDHEQGSFPEKMDFVIDAVDEIEFVYDPEEDEGWGKADQEYDGELRHVNKPPTVLRRMAASEPAEGEVAAIQAAMRAWAVMQPGMRGAGGGVEAGSVDRGEPREAIMASSMMELASSAERVAWPSVGGTLSTDCPASGGGGRFLGLDVIDYETLEEVAREHPLEDDDWY